MKKPHKPQQLRKMTEKQTIDYNILIAEFDGHFNPTIEYTTRKGIAYNWKEDLVEIKSMRYKDSWDAMAPAWSKLCKISDGITSGTLNSEMGMDVIRMRFGRAMEQNNTESGYIQLVKAIENYNKFVKNK